MQVPALEIQVPAADAQELTAALDGASALYSTATVKHFNGSDVVSIVVMLTPQILSFLAGLYLARTNAKKHVTFKSRGLEVKGVSEQTLLKLYEAESKRLKEKG